jgi:hypothetical protein
VTRLLLASMAALAAAVPANAAVAPACATRLVHAAAGASASCATDGTPRPGSATVLRTATVVVAEGVARVTIRCGGPTAPSRSVTVSGAEPGSVEMYEDFGSYCTTTVEAVHPNTTVSVTSTFSYAFINPGV